MLAKEATGSNQVLRMGCSTHDSLEGQANTIASAVYAVLAEGKIQTADMGGELCFPLLSRMEGAAGRRH